MNKNVYKVAVREIKYKEEWAHCVGSFVIEQIVIGLDNLKILLDAYPTSTWETVKDNGEGSYYE